MSTIYKWNEKRAHGMKRCICRVELARAGSENCTPRKSLAWKGARCRNFVTAATVARLGKPVCKQHEPAWLRRRDGREAVRLILRTKYDPGPQYEE